MIGLLLVKKSCSLGAYEPYHLSTHSGNTSGYNDAIAVRDQLLWLPLGKKRRRHLIAHLKLETHCVAGARGATR